MTVGLYSGPWKLVRRGFPPDETYALYDLRRDAIGERDVQDEHPAVFADLCDLLTELRELGDARDQASEAFTQSADGLKALGYVGDA